MVLTIHIMGRDPVEHPKGAKQKTTRYAGEEQGVIQKNHLSDIITDIIRLFKPKLYKKKGDFNGK